MSAALYEGQVEHVRLAGRRGAFRHGVYAWLVDVDRLPRLPLPLRPFARVRAGDHLGDPAASLRANVERFCAAEGLPLDAGPITLLTNARVLGWAFNPLSVFWCHAEDGTLRCVVAEVHNTYGERHCYLLRPDSDGRCEADKAFYVSPFLEVRGRYRLRLPEPGARVALGVELDQDGATVFAATLQGERREANAAELARLLWRYQWMTLRVSALIRLHGLSLWARGQRVVPRPRGGAA